MQEKEKIQNWGVNDYCRNLSAEMIAQYLSIFGVNLQTFKPFLNSLQFTEQEEETIKTFQTSKISKFANMIISSQSKMSAFRSLLETSYLRGTFPQKLEYNFGYPKNITHRLISLPYTQRCLNLRILVQMFLSSVQKKVHWITDGEVVKLIQIQENSKFLKKDTEKIFERIVFEEKIYIQIHHTVFPDNQPTVFGLPISHKSSFFIKMWILLEEEDYYHVISMDYLSARSLAFNQMNKIDCYQIDYSEYLQNKRNWENNNLEKLSFKGLNPFNWLEERPDLMERPNTTVSESRNWDQLALVSLSNSQVNSSMSGKVDSSISSIGKQNIQQILEEKQFIVQPIPIEQCQQKKSCLASSRSLIIDKVGEFSSVIDGKLIYDKGILRLTEYEDGDKSQLIFSTVTKGDLFLDRDIVIKSKLSSWLRSQMDQFPIACQTQAHEGSLQLEQMEMEQLLEKDQQFKQLPKINKIVKGSKKNPKKIARRRE